MPLIFLAMLILLPTMAQAKHAHPERYYQQQWCAEYGEQIEVILEGGGRVDCLTATHAVELDFAPKWAEAIGQAMYYSAMTHHKAGIVLICEGDCHPYIERARCAIDYYRLPVDIWTVPENQDKGLAY